MCSELVLTLEVAIAARERCHDSASGKERCHFAEEPIRLPCVTPISWKHAVAVLSVFGIDYSSNVMPWGIVREVALVLG